MVKSVLQSLFSAFSAPAPIDLERLGGVREQMENLLLEFGFTVLYLPFRGQGFNSSHVICYEKCEDLPPHIDERVATSHVLFLNTDKPLRDIYLNAAYVLNILAAEDAETFEQQQECLTVVREVLGACLGYPPIAASDDSRAKIILLDDFRPK